MSNIAHEKLSVRHLAFANGIIEGKTQEQAYINAGYSEKTAGPASSRLLVIKPQIQKYINSQKQKVAEESNIHMQWVVDRLFIEASNNEASSGIKLQALKLLTSASDKILLSGIDANIKEMSNNELFTLVSEICS